MILEKKDNSVNLTLHPDFAQAAPYLKAAFRMAGGRAVVTSGRDGVHSANSRHYTGDAIDLRRWGIDMDSQRFCQRLAATLNDNCPGKWYVVLEKDHIHLERADNGERPNIKGWTAGQFSYYHGAA